MYHAKFSGDLYKTLDAGVTGFAIWTLEESADRAQFHETLAKVVAQSSTSESDGVFVGGFAEVIEDQRKFFVAIGWENMEVRLGDILIVLDAQTLLHPAFPGRLRGQCGSGGGPACRVETDRSRY